jgi:hypothetical protein
VRVEGAATGLRPGDLVAEQAFRPVAVGRVGVVGLVEEPGQGAPSRPARQDGLVRGRGGDAPLEPVEDLERGEVGGELGRRARRSEVLLAAGPERLRYPAGASVQSAARLLVALPIAASLAR